MRLYLIRHGKPDIDGGICYGSTDLPVRAEVHRNVIDALLPSLPHGAPVLSSPLQRCRMLAEAVVVAVGADKVFPDRRLAEIHFGDWEMRTWDEIPRAEVDAWAADIVHYRPGGGENVLDVATRVRAFYDELRVAGFSEALVVCHAGTIRLLQQCRLHLLPADIARHAGAERHAVAYGEMIVFDCQ